jgi:CxxC-x17-CxxC domain-containing protein
MKKPQRSNKSGGWKGEKTFGSKKPAFGSKKPWERGSDSRSSGKTFMHKATCSECNRACEVPFVPTGRKPILCSMCFKKDGDFSPKKFGASSYGDKPSYKPAYAGTDTTAAQLKIINTKLDAILKALNGEE